MRIHQKKGRTHQRTTTKYQIKKKQNIINEHIIIRNREYNGLIIKYKLFDCDEEIEEMLVEIMNGHSNQQR